MADVVFIGVTTGSSLAHKAIAHWEPLLGVSFGLRGIDICLDADDNVYKDLLDELRRNRSVLGAVVTTHKLRLYQAGRTRFSWLDPLAIACEEINAIRRNSDGSLEGWARDPISVGRVVDRIWPHTTGQVICLGAGGTAVALAHHLVTKRGTVRFVCADPNPDAAARLARLTSHSVVCHVGSGPWDDLVSSAPPGSLIVNATGLGKDRPGSPTTDQARFPQRSVVWELNYRGDLQIFNQACRQADESRLEVHDGWQLFCDGWAAALSVVLDLPDDAKLGVRFAESARDIRATQN